ncbi:hypothetical protein DTL36_22260 [Bremerella cremea]|nr:hypothetical protein DTL36_22260 [Bremerella cremea]
MAVFNRFFPDLLSEIET